MSYCPRMIKLSALVVVHNEEAILADCLAALRFADEIVVVLDRCSDGSERIALDAGAKTVRGAWPIEGERRHAGIDACAGPWILEIDADERVDAALADEILIAVRADACDFMFIPMRNHVAGRWVRFGWMAALAPDLKGCLFRKGHKIWGSERVHPATDFEGRRGADLRHGIEHDFARDISGLMKRFNRNTSLKADDMVARGERAKTRTMARKALSRFWKCYVSRKGYRERAVGFAVAILCALYPLVAHLKAEEIRSRPETG